MYNQYQPFCLSVCRSVGRSVCLPACLPASLPACNDCEPYKNGWTDRNAICCVDSAGPKENVVQIPPRKGHFWWGMTSGFSRTLQTTVPSGPDVGIFPRAVKQHSSCPTAEAVECHVRFSHWKVPPAMCPVVNILWPLVNTFAVMCIAVVAALLDGLDWTMVQVLWSVPSNLAVP